MKIASWNVNSLRVRLPHVLEWLDKHQPDIVGLQETKLPDDDFPAEAFFEAGYVALSNGQKTYNGVALLSHEQRLGEPEDLVTSLPGLTDGQRRVLGARYNGLTVLDLYVPNGQSVGSDKYDYKLRWFEALIDYAAGLDCPTVLIGDFNIAPQDRDIHDPESWRGKIMCSDAERAVLTRLCENGLSDTFRLFEQPDDSFSWWDYRMNGFERNRGLRIDLVLASAGLAGQCTAAGIDTAPRALDRPSDHAPVWADFDWPLRD